MGRQVEPDRIYRHSCMTARALEVVGERWSLLIVRDLLPGPRRFTYLARSLDPITPARLTDRLRRLEAAGVITRRSATRGREVWYELTDAGLISGRRSTSSPSGGSSTPRSLRDRMSPSTAKPR